MEANAWTVGIAALGTALATGVGAAPFFFRGGIGRSWLGVSNAAAAGFMLGASVQLVLEGVEYGTGRVAAGAAAGAAFVVVAQRALHAREHLHVGGLGGADARKALAIVAVMTAHSVTEGVGVGVSYGGGEALGAFITAAIAIHNIPEGLAISLVLVPRGTSPLRAAGWSVFSSLPQPLLAVPAFVFVEAFLGILPAGLGFAAGAMAWMVASELLPDAYAETSLGSAAATLLAAFGVMMLLQALLAV